MRGVSAAALQRWGGALACGFVLAFAQGCASSPAIRPVSYRRPLYRDDPTLSAEGASPAGATLDGLATWYSDSLAGRHTASGVAYDPARFTAAHRTLPLGTRLRVWRTDRSFAPVDVLVNDRGPFGDSRRVLDLSRAAATALGMLRAGVVPVRAEVLEVGRGRRAAR